MALLDVDSIHTSYGRSKVLHGVSLSVTGGEVVSLLGRNGAGKTTTVRSIAGLTPASEGTIVFDDQEITDWSPEHISKAGISLVPEDRDIFPSLTVEENLRLGGMAHDDSAGRLARIYDYFARLDERRTQLAGQMSGGERQMLAIGRSLMTNPDLLILDEPSEGLAPVIVDDLVDILNEIRGEEAAILLIEQNTEIAMKLADRHYIIETGQNRFHGTTTELKQNEEILETTLGVRQKEVD
ncbi:ABC transporter ATP-binding protein [Haloarchaeobius salinus]|uniref:ABC transporter ATP-binding protein n=1 Tax=Haloarchaeobius salinus TaxID=1198298 RepID=UPI00210E1862|nr:ABC transporter ATP-binding protein [Haloarchaeobius salinus]